MKSFILVLVLILGSIGSLLWYLSDAPGVNPTNAAFAPSEEVTEVSTRLRKHVETLSRDIGTRGAHQTSALAAAFDYVEGEARRAGLSATRHAFDVKAGRAQNLELEILGTRNQHEFVVVGAHLDSPRRSPGADANASGCAVLLEMGRTLATSGCGRTVRLVFFSGGEEPIAGTDDQGSRAYAKSARDKKEKIVAMYALDGLGMFRPAAGTQSAPFPFSIFYPDKGDFVAFVSDFGGRALMRQSVMLFRSTQFPAEGGTYPSWFPGMSDTDSTSFSTHGYPSVLVTDTGSLRSDTFGTPSDTFDRLDYDRMARVAGALTRVVSTMANASGTLQ